MTRDRRDLAARPRTAGPTVTARFTDLKSVALKLCVPCQPLSLLTESGSESESAAAGSGRPDHSESRQLSSS